MSDKKDEQLSGEIAGFEFVLNSLVAAPEIATIMQAHGFPQERIDAGLALVQTARAKQQARGVEVGNRLKATTNFEQAFAAASKAYADFRETARAHFESASANPDAWESLKLTGVTPRKVDSFIDTAYATYDNALANPEIMAALAPYGYVAAKIGEARGLVAAVRAADQTQEHAKGAALRATTEQDEAVEQAKAWVKAFKRIARRALLDRPDLLVKLKM